MSAIKKILEATQGLRAFKRPDSPARAASESGARKGASGGSDERPGNDDVAIELRQAEQRIQHQRWQIQQLSQELKALREKVSEDVYGSGYRGIQPENVVWIFGTARTGSTWLAFMMEELEGTAVWREPYVGALFGRFYYEWVGEKHFKTKHFILGERARESWVRSVRSFILNEASVRFPEVIDGGRLVIKEPNGSAGAPLLMEALPESRMILLVRDPRDVVASVFDAARDGGWLNEQSDRDASERAALADRKPNVFVKRRAMVYLQSVGAAMKAYDAHRRPKTLVRYEDLRAETLTEMKRIYSELGITVDGAELEKAVEKHSWERVPESEKGKGKARRKARPGSWVEDLSEEQAGVVEQVTAPILEKFYPEGGGGRRGPGPA